MFRESAPCLLVDTVGPGAPGFAMATSATDVKRLLRLAERMGLPANEAIHQVRDLAPDAETPNRPPRPSKPNDRS